MYKKWTALEQVCLYNQVQAEKSRRNGNRVSEAFWEEMGNKYGTTKGSARMRYKELVDKGHVNLPKKVLETDVAHELWAMRNEYYKKKTNKGLLKWLKSA